MSVDILQDKIRKTKNPSLVELALPLSDLPEGFTPDAAGYGRFCRELLEGLRGIVPGVRVSFSAFALLGSEGICELSSVLKFAGENGFYVLLDAPEIWSAAAAELTAQVLFAGQSIYPCDGIVISGYMGSDVIKPFLSGCKESGKDLFVVARTANKSAPEIQDLLAGSRLVHIATADHVNRYCGETVGKFGYSRLGILGAASAADSLRNLRSKYPKLFILLDGFDYPNSNAKNCSYAFDKFGHGAAACAGRSILCAGKDTDNPEENWLEASVAAAERVKKNLTRYVNIL